MDFGFARKLDPDQEVRVMQGTPEFVSPEVIRYQPISLKTDCWSVGVLSYVLLSGLSPFRGDNNQVSLFSLHKILDSVEPMMCRQQENSFYLVRRHAATDETQFCCVTILVLLEVGMTP